MSSGFWAGAGAADYARRTRIAPRVRRTGGVALDGNGNHEIDPAALVHAVQAEVFPFDRNYFRTGEVLNDSVKRLDTLWRSTRLAGSSSSERLPKAREAAARLATARWMYRSALARTETRGMHKRYDHLQQDARQRQYLTVGGLDEVRVTSRPAPALPAEERAA
jgi:succinate dehydrogenase/fumarate reductase flavoprotein subunit